MPQSIVRHEHVHLYAAEPQTEAGRDLSNAILELRHAEQVQADRSQRISGLGGIDLSALRYLVQARRETREVSPKDLIVMLGTSSATVTNVIERLVGKGYVMRQQHPTDRRAHYLVPTDAATALVDEVYGGHHGAVVSVIDQLDEDELVVTAKVIRRIAQTLDELATRS
ncbi:MarR family winged helix-turn-helix transcriptional regulator [Microbacterium sp. 179-B 1A2 NHS]|uniref:MarR family winged helix-turn-helix transcriptional regulator n=1 Tax=Microbacterium sp. 179-B 1A2 NHS TaxID=3142383 RepID=UPI0039A39B09